MIRVALLLAEGFEEAEAMLMEIVREIQIEEGMIPKLTEAEASECT